MRIPLAAFCITLLSGCGDQITETYASHADARRVGAVKRGWVPGFVPASARDISDSHDIDTNRQTLRFKVPATAVPAMVQGLDRIRDEADIVRMARSRGLGTATQSWLVCTQPVSGVLFVDRTSGSALYDTTIEWAERACSKGPDRGSGGRID
jgi:hypothetical protein